MTDKLPETSGVPTEAGNYLFNLEYKQVYREADGELYVTDVENRGGELLSAFSGGDWCRIYFERPPLDCPVDEVIEAIKIEATQKGHPFANGYTCGMQRAAKIIRSHQVKEGER